MNILYHHRTRARGAEGLHIREIANAFSLLGNNVTIVSPPGVAVNEKKKSNSTYFGFVFFSWMSRIICLYTPQIIFVVFELLYNFYAVVIIPWKIVRLRISGIYERMAFFCWAGVFCAKLFHIPIIIEINEISGIKRARSQRLLTLAKIIEQYIFSQADALVVVSSYLKKQLLARGVSETKIHVIPNAINPEYFHPDSEREEIRTRLNLKDKKVIGFVGVFVPWDNLERLVDVFHNLKIKHNDLFLLLVGDGITRKSLENLVSKYGLQKDVLITGLIPREQVNGYIDGMDICVLPASNQFGSPIAMFEYMGMGKPVVVPDVGPVKEIVTHGVNAMVFDHEQLADLEKKLDDCIKDSEMSARIGTAARKLVLEKHTWLDNAKYLNSIF